MTLNLYGLAKCSTCQKAMAWLDEHGIAYRLSDVKSEPVTGDQVAAWSKALGGWDKLINKSGFTWRGLPPESKSALNETTAILLAVENPSLIRRPLIEHHDATVTVGFSKKVQETLS